jgi:hypothetical protein
VSPPVSHTQLKSLALIHGITKESKGYVPSLLDTIPIVFTFSDFKEKVVDTENKFMILLKI